MPKVLWRGNETQTVGPQLAVGDRAPVNFTLAAHDLSPVPGTALAGQLRILLTSPSLDTPVCDIEARRFNTEAAAIPGATVYFVTLDLPFALKRYCGAAGIDRVKTLSDFKDRTFGPAYGVLAPSKGLFVRAVFVVGADDVIRHVEYVKEVAAEPDYAAALAAARSLLKPSA